jgi:hypothetical protein
MLLAGDLIIAALVAFVTYLNVTLFVAIMRQQKPEPRKAEVIVRSVFAGDVVQEERIVVEPCLRSQPN